MVRLDGAVENAVRLGVADVIADVVETGATLRQAGLVTIGEPILRVVGGADRRRRAGAAGRSSQLLRRLQGVLVARRYVMLAYDVPADLLDAGQRADPGHRVADGLAAAPRGLGRGAGDGAARPTCTGSWTSCTSWAPAPSWSPTSRLPAVSGAFPSAVGRQDGGSVTSVDTETVTFRPRRIRWVAGIAAGAVVVLFTVLSFGLRGSAGFENSGQFQRGDQAAMIGLGILIGLRHPGVHPAAGDRRRRAHPDPQRGRRLRPALVGGPRGAVRPELAVGQLELHDDEQVSVHALQAADKDYAVEGVRALRALHSAAVAA